jgi:2-polyprenyl-3-methyl-5-hydroxy-6-metoxy-1,4-benzoquinol methylase
MSTTLHEYERESQAPHAHDDYWAQARRATIQTWLADDSPQEILDVGCGSGYLATEIPQTPKVIAGVDIEERSVELAADRQAVDLAVVGDATALPFDADSFDCVILADVLEHFENPDQLLGECRRVLTEDGRLIVSVPAFRWLRGPHDEHNGHADRFTRSRLDSVLSKIGFIPVAHRYTNFFPLPAYFVLQRVLKSGVPGAVRGGHSAAIEMCKRILLWIESRIQFPIGVTLLGKFRPAAGSPDGPQRQ